MEYIGILTTNSAEPHDQNRLRRGCVRGTSERSVAFGNLLRPKHYLQASVAYLGTALSENSQVETLTIMTGGDHRDFGFLECLAPRMIFYS